MYVDIHAYIPTCMHTYIHTYTYIPIHTYIHTRTHILEHTHTCSIHTYIHTNILVYSIHPRNLIHMHTCEYTKAH